LVIGLVTMIHRQALVDYLATALQPERVVDYCPNGLQVEGRDTITRLVTGVTASARFIRQAIAANADAILVHHGYFWKGEAASIVGYKAERIRLLLGHELNLLAYHLPLDTHAQWGNNACLGQKLGITPRPPVRVAGVDGLLWHGDLAAPVAPQAFANQLAECLGQAPLHVGDGPSSIEHVGWCSGGGQGFLSAAAALGVDAYFSGEISEPTTHEARELQVHYWAAGHHATERFGVQALGEHLAAKFALEHVFIDDPNPA